MYREVPVLLISYNLWFGSDKERLQINTEEKEWETVKTVATI